MKPKLHTTEHILYTILDAKFKIKSKALEFKEDFGRVVYECSEDIRGFKDDLEQEVNNTIKRNLDVTSYILPRDKIQNNIDLSLLPASMKEVNIYEIMGFNRLACIGPHVKNTNEIKSFKIIKIEKKGKNIYSIKFTVR